MYVSELSTEQAVLVSCPVEQDAFFIFVLCSSPIEKQFSEAGLIINERQNNLKPEQLDNALLIR